MANGPLVLFGHDISGTTANRPTNVESGQPYYNTDEQTQQVYDGVAGAWKTGTGDVGTFSSTAGAGFALSSSANKARQIYGDDAGVTMTGDIRNLLSRVLLTIDHAAVTINAIRGQIKMLDLVDITHANSVVSPIRGYFEMAGTGARTLTGHVAGVRAALEEGASGTTTIAASSFYGGFEATLNSTRTYTETGTMGAFIANISGGTTKWTKAFYADAAGCDTGCYIGKHGNAGGEGLLIGAITAANRFHADDGGAAIAAGNLRNILARTNLTTTSTNAASVRSIVGQIKVQASVDLSSANSVVAGVMGYLEIGGDTTFAGQVAAGEFTIESAGDTTVSAGGEMYGVASRINYASGKGITSTGFSAAYFAGTTGAAADTWDAALHVDGVDVLIRGETASDYEDGFKAVVNTPTGNITHALKFMVGSTAVYVPGYVSDAFGN